MPVVPAIHCPVCGNHISLGSMIVNTPWIINIMGSAYIRCENVIHGLFIIIRKVLLNLRNDYLGGKYYGKKS